MKKLNLGKLKEAMKSSSTGDGQSRWKPPVGTSIFRLLPIPDKSNLDLPWIYNVKHYNLPTIDRPALCSQEYKINNGYANPVSGACPVCSVINHLKKLEDETYQPVINEYKASNRFTAQVLPLMENKKKVTEFRVMLFDFGIKVYRGLQNCFTDQDEFDTSGSSDEEVNVIDITDPAEGYHLALKKEHTGGHKKNVDYALSRAKSVSKVPNWAKIKDELLCLEDYIEKDTDTEALLASAKLIAKNCNVSIPLFDGQNATVKPDKNSIDISDPSDDEDFSDLGE